MTYEPRMVFKFLKNHKQHGEDCDQMVCGPQSLKYMLSGPLQKKTLTLVTQQKM